MPRRRQTYQNLKSKMHLIVVLHCFFLGLLILRGTHYICHNFCELRKIQQRNCSSLTLMAVLRKINVSLFLNKFKTVMLL